jgi:ribosome-associated translation inhibitor RaiA
MGTYLYCIHADSVGVPAALVGIDGAAVRAVDASSLEAWVSDIGEIPVTVSVERMRAHDAVCAAALASNETPLPIRFGQAFASDEDARAAISAKASQLAKRLRRVSGCVELRVVVRPHRDSSISSAGADVATDEDASEPDRPGTAFLRRLAREGREDLAREVSCEEARQALRSVARTLIVDQQACESARGVSYFPLLVRRTDVDTVRDMATRVLSSQSSQTLVMGPFAPYSFAGDA